MIDTTAGSRIVAVDPGASGAVAFYDVRKNFIVVWPFPESPSALFSLMQQLRGFDPQYVLVEAVHAMPGNGVVSMFTFGFNLGRAEQAMSDARLDFERVAPVTWQKPFKGDRKFKTYAERKAFFWAQANALSQSVQVRCPANRKLIKALADAVMIAQFAKLYYVDRSIR